MFKGLQTEVVSDNLTTWTLPDLKRELKILKADIKWVEEPELIKKLEKEVEKRHNAKMDKKIKRVGSWLGL